MESQIDNAQLVPLELTSTAELTKHPVDWNVSIPRTHARTYTRIHTLCMYTYTYVSPDENTPTIIK